MALNFLAKSGTYQESTEIEVLQRRAVTVAYLRPDYTLDSPNFKLAKKHLRGITRCSNPASIIKTDAELYQTLYSYLIGTQKEREELLLSVDGEIKRVIGYLKQDGIEFWQNLGFDPRKYAPIRVVTSVKDSLDIMRERTNLPDPPAEEAEGLFGRDLKRARLCLTETRYLFKVIEGYEAIPLEFVFQEVKPIVERRARFLEKGQRPRFRLTKGFLITAFKQKGSKFTLSRNNEVSMIR